jgi:hypothetical protein
MQGGSIPGTEFPGKYYLYESLRVPDIGYEKRMSLNFRYIHSWMDQSGIAFVSGDQAMSDHINLVFEASASRGNPNSEFTLMEKTTVMAGAKVSL